MNRAQKKARLKGIKRRQKLARSAGSDTSSSGQAELGGADALPVDEGLLADAPVADPAAAAEVLQVALDEARGRVASSRELDSHRARGMLARAAEFLDEVIATTREALAQVPADRKREALAIINAKPEADGVSAQKRPRRGPDPVVTLMRIGMQAASLLQRVLGKTNPELGRLKRAA